MDDSKNKNYLVSNKEISDFKNFYCDENKIIPRLLKEKFKEYFLEPILDVGSGMGDITADVVPEKEVIHLDIEVYSNHKLPKNHKRVVGDFLKYSLNEKVKTIIFSHSLQYIDNDVGKLNEIIETINPEKIITITNNNKDFMGKLIEWFKNNYDRANPEVALINFPNGYKLEKVESFTALIKCNSFDNLAVQLSKVIFDCELPDIKLNDFSIFLKSNLEKPEFTIDESIIVYTKNI